MKFRDVKCSKCKKIISTTEPNPHCNQCKIPMITVLKMFNERWNLK